MPFTDYITFCLLRAWQGLHWLASHEPHWPKAKWPELHHYHELKPNARLHWPDKVRFPPSGTASANAIPFSAHRLTRASHDAQETGALDALRKAVEDAGKHHAHVSGHLNANMNRMSPMWGEVRRPPVLATRLFCFPAWGNVQESHRLGSTSLTSVSLFTCRRMLASSTASRSRRSCRRSSWTIRSSWSESPAARAEATHHRSPLSSAPP